jgi:hypothetical protein
VGATTASGAAGRLPAVVLDARALLLGCFALACLSLAGPLAISYDPWGWLVWGREVTQLGLDTTGGPSWKPLPVLFTSVFALFGDAAPTLWLIVARTGGFLALALAYRLATRFAGPGAGVVAAVALLLTPDDASRFVRYMAQGNIEPLLIALCLGAVDRHLDGRRGQAFALLALAALARPEVWPFLALYAAWLWWKDPSTRWLVTALLALVPLLWFGGDWWGSGDPLTGGDRARVIGSQADRAGLALERAFGAAILPVWVGAAGAVAMAVRRRERLALALAGSALGWIAVVVGMAIVFGFAASARFFAPAAAILCVLAGVGAVRLVAAADRRWARIAVVAVLVAATVPFALPRVLALETQGVEASSRAVLLADLDVALARAGGPRVVAGCGALATDLEYISAQPALAWKLNLPMDVIGHRIGDGPGIIFALAGGARYERLSSDPATRARALALTEEWGVFAFGCPRA